MKNIKNILLAISICLNAALLIYAFYQQTVAEKTLTELQEQKAMAEEARKQALISRMHAEKQLEKAKRAAQEAEAKRAKE